LTSQIEDWDPNYLKFEQPHPINKKKAYKFTCEIKQNHEKYNLYEAFS